MGTSERGSIVTWLSSLRGWFLSSESQAVGQKEVADGQRNDFKNAEFVLEENSTVTELKMKGINTEAVHLKTASPEYEAGDEKNAKLPTRVKNAILEKLEKDGFTIETNSIKKGVKDGLLGQGGFGAVYHMRNVSQKSTCAVKLIFHSRGSSHKYPKSGDVKNMKSEIEPFSLAKSRDPGAKRLVNCMKAFLIHTSFDRIIDAKGKRQIENYYNGVIVMDYCDYSLQDIYRHRRERAGGKKLSEKLIASWFFGMAEGLAYLHSRKVAHNDIKPENVLLWRKRDIQPKASQEQEMEDDDYLRKSFDLKLADYGIARHFGQHQFDMYDTKMKGTAPYMAPEMFRSAHLRTYAQEPTDIWALGVSVWELVHFRLPFNIGGNLEEIKVSVFKVAPNVARYNAWSNIDRDPPLLEMLLWSCLALDVNYRFTAAQIVQHVYFDILDEP